MKNPFTQAMLDMQLALGLMHEMGMLAGKGRAKHEARLQGRRSSNKFGPEQSGCGAREVARRLRQAGRA